MKLFSTVVLVVLFTLSGFAQSYKEEVTKNAETYYEYMTNQNFDGVLDYMYPKVFDKVPREQLKLGMEQMFNSPEMKIEFVSNTVTDVSDKVEEEGISYAAVFYNSKMRMTFISEKDKPEEEQKSFLEFMSGIMKTQFGEENVTSELKTVSLLVNMDANMFAIKDPKYKGWKFVGNDDAMKALVDSIIPENIRTKLLKTKD